MTQPVTSCRPQPSMSIDSSLDAPTMSKLSGAPRAVKTGPTMQSAPPQNAAKGAQALVRGHDAARQAACDRATVGAGISCAFSAVQATAVVATAAPTVVGSVLAAAVCTRAIIQCAEAVEDRNQICR